MGQPFYTTKEKGTGLGFMISKKIIDNHFGEIHIESEVNKGTIIEVILPFVNKTANYSTEIAIN
ncbi:hypothetical protein COJ46_09380 [Bacillus sp. AFS077874]|nr:MULTISPECIES: ATP-binding protein [unclassified Bacillus (in: firmicutes)]PEC48445.1 hypothetical protein CON00_16190 [Bacillus sp. AFS096315]PFM81126.1 hypothetical protein COJ46_09380 [Bacillus sp. AFS077874]